MLRFGAAYYPDHWPEGQWTRDLDAMSEAGITTVRFGEFSWSWFESAPGRFDFSAYDRFIALAASKGLQLVLCTPTATPPPWFDRKFPDGRMLNAHGERCLSPRHFWCWNHAASRSQAEKTIHRLVRRYADHPAVRGWQIDNEPNYAEERHLHDPMRGYDFHPASRRAFVEWLRLKYDGSLAALNEAWWANFWSQRCHTWEETGLVRGKTNPHAWLDFMRWRDSDVAGFVHWQRDLLRELAPRQSVGCNIPQAGVALSLEIAQDPWQQAGGLDWVGTDLYEATGDRKRDMQRLAFSCDFMRSVSGKADFLISETQAGPHRRWWRQSFAGEAFGPDYLENCASLYSLHGAREVWWFLFRPTLGGFEMGMNGLVEMNGRPGPRHACARKIASPRTASRFARAQQRRLQRPVAKIAYCRDSLLFASNQPADLADLDPSFCGWHAWLQDAGFRVEFVDVRQWLPESGEELLAIPYMPLVREDWLDALKTWQGPLWLGPHCFLGNEHGHLRANVDAVAALAGCRSGDWYDLPQASERWQGSTIPGYRHFEPEKNARILSRFSSGNPAIVGCSRKVSLAFDGGLAYFSGSARVKSALRRILQASLS